MRRTVRLVLVGAALACGVFAAGPAPLAAQPRRPVPPSRATAAPPAPLDSAWIVSHPAQFKAYLRVLVFDTTLRGADRRVLMQMRSGTDSMRFVGPKAELAPEVGAALIDRRWPVLGRVLARITLWSDSAYGAPGGIHLQPGVTYFVVRSDTGRASGLVGYLVAVASDTTVRLIESVDVEALPGRGPARFILSPRDDRICVPCDSQWCCPPKTE